MGDHSVYGEAFPLAVNGLVISEEIRWIALVWYWVFAFRLPKYFDNGGNDATALSYGTVQCSIKARYRASCPGNPVIFLDAGGAVVVSVAY